MSRTAREQFNDEAMPHVRALLRTASRLCGTLASTRPVIPCSRRIRERSWAT